MSPPTARALAASSAPCDDIQMLCQASISTAMPSTMALNSSWPMPLANEPMTSVKAATTPAPANPASSPAMSQRLLPGMLCVAAATMPMMSAASSTSRKTIMAVPNMVCLLLRDDRALRGRRVEFAHEGVASCIQRPDVERCAAMPGNDLLAVQRKAVEFFRCGILVLYQQLDLLAGGDDQFGRLETMLLDNQRIVG